MCANHLAGSKEGQGNLDANGVKSGSERSRSEAGVLCGRLKGCAEGFPQFFIFWRQDETLYMTE